MTDRAEFKSSKTWRVLSTRDCDCSAGYWTSSYVDRADAQAHADHMEVNTVYEVEDVFMWQDGKIVQHVSETWRKLI